MNMFGLRNKELERHSTLQWQSVVHFLFVENNSGAEIHKKIKITLGITG